MKKIRKSVKIICVVLVIIAAVIAAKKIHVTVKIESNVEEIATTNAVPTNAVSTNLPPVAVDTNNIPIQ